jgi:hypothetical protein
VKETAEKVVDRVKETAEKAVDKVKDSAEKPSVHPSRASGRT